MKAYVLGFAFDDLGRVVLIHKTRPEWQRNLWNGVGGKIEAGETPVAAMCREFREETGVVSVSTDWLQIGTMLNPDWFVYVFMAKHFAFRECRTMTDEHVHLWPTWRLPQNLIPNLPAMISIAEIANLADRPVFHFTYS